jgi:MFS family permease
MDPQATGQSRRERLPILALLCANAISLLGNQLTLIAVPWFVLQTTGSATKTGFTGFFSLLPLLNGGVFGGLIVDRLGFRRASILADLGSGLMVALVPLLYHTIGLEYWQLLALVFLRSLVGTPGGTARQGLLPDLVALSGFGRERINATFQGIGSLTALFGAPLAGLLIVALGPSNVLWLDAASFVISALIVTAAVPGSHAIGASVASPVSNQHMGVFAGFDFLRRDRTLLSLILCGTALNFFGAAFGGVIMPVYASRLLGGVVDLGTISAGSGAGGLLGTVFFGLVGHRLPRRAFFVSAFVLSALPLWVYVGLPALLVSVAASLSYNLILTPLNPLVGTIMQERVPAELRGRVFGLILTLILAAAPLGLLIVGFALDAIGLRATLLALASAYTVVTVGMAVNPGLRGLDASRPAASNDPRRRGATAGSATA